MTRLAAVAPHLTLDELSARFRACKEVTEKFHLQAILLRAQGMSTAEVASICGFNVDWVRRLVRRYNTLGPDSLGDRRQANGRELLLSPELMAELHDAVVNSEPRSGGLWTGPKVAQWMSQKLGRDVSPQLAWDYLQRLRLSKQTPRPRHTAARADDQALFKKNSAGV